MLTGLGYVEDREVAVVSEGCRAIFEHPGNRLHLDVFYDKLDFCHVISLAGRLELDRPTLPLAELALGKLQIVKINEKDLIDLTVLLLEHPWGEGDEREFNLGRIARLCAEDWGLCRTTTLNLEKMARFAGTLERSRRSSSVWAQIEALTGAWRQSPSPSPGACGPRWATG